jgi:6-phosphogluconolactonase
MTAISTANSWNGKITLNQSKIGRDTPRTIMTNNIKVAADITTLVSEVSAWIQGQLLQAIAERGEATIVLAGGSTPKVIYQALAASNLPWEQLHVFWGDERYVPPTDPESNELMARQNWLDLVPIPATHIHPWPTQAGQPAACVEQYETEILQHFSLAPGAWPQFDLILLGMGDDGHTASLFPQTEALQVVDRLTAVGNKDGQSRLTLTVPAINRARCVAFIVAGSNKQAALDRVFSATTDPLQYPSKLIQPSGELWWWLDAAAAGKNLQT